MILSITLPDPTKSGAQVSLFSCTGMEKFDNLLNKIKMRALEFLGQVFKYLFEKVVVEVKMTSPFLGKAL